jgi:hypothetical protein
LDKRNSVAEQGRVATVTPLSLFGEALDKLRYDITTGVITIILLPLAYLILRKIFSILKKLFSYLLDWVIWSIGRSVFHTLASRISLRRYCAEQLLNARTRYLRVPGAGDVALETDTVYVSMTLEPSVGDALQEGALLRTLNRFRILGDPGSGKSSIVKRLYRDACYAATRRPSSARLPILIDLKTFRPDVDDPSDNDLITDWAVAQLRAEVASNATFEMGECFDACLNGPGLVVLLDGLDEVSSTNYADVCRAINLVSKWLERNSPTSVIVLTMRTQFHEQVHQDFEEAFPPAYYVRRFTPNDIYQFLLRWPFPSGEREAASTAIYETLSDRPSLREMCTSPLVLAMYVVAHGKTADDDSFLPETRTDFYAQVLEELLVARRGRQLGSTTARRALRDQREYILGRLAWENLRDPEATPNLLSWPAALEIVREHLALPTTQAADSYFLELSKETGLFTIGKSGETFQFIHLTFCEFLAGKEVANGIHDGWSELIEVQTRLACSPLTKTRLSEVIPFACALLPRQARTTAIQEVAELGEGPTLARCFLETQMYAHAAWLEFAANELSALSGTDPDSWNEEWADRLHLYMVTLANAERWASVTRSHLPSSVQPADVYEKLVGESEDRLVRVFASLAAVDGAAALRLAETLGFDLVQHRPDLMVLACKEPSMLVTAANRFDASVGKNRDHWAAILVDAALLYRNVAGWLNRRSPSRNYRAMGPDESLAWAVEGVRGMYGECLSTGTNAVREKTVDANQFPRLGILMGAKPWGFCVPRVLITACMLLPALFALLLVVAFDAGEKGVAEQVALGVVVLACYALGFALDLYPAYRRDVYSAILNLPAMSFGSRGRFARLIKYVSARRSLRVIFGPFYQRVLRREIAVAGKMSTNRRESLAERK